MKIISAAFDSTIKNIIDKTKNFLVTNGNTIVVKMRQDLINRFGSKGLKEPILLFSKKGYDVLSRKFPFLKIVTFAGYLMYIDSFKCSSDNMNHPFYEFDTQGEVSFIYLFSFKTELEPTLSSECSDLFIISNCDTKWKTGVYCQYIPGRTLTEVNSEPGSLDKTFSSGSFLHGCHGFNRTLC